MPSPPLSPIPRRINTPSMVDLLSSLERSSEDGRGFPGWRDAPSRPDEEGEVEDLLVPVGPDIRTTSPSPRRSDRLSPLSGGTCGSPRQGELSSAHAPSRADAPAAIQHPQDTGQSVSTIDQAFADIHSTLYQLASGRPSPQPHALPLPPSPIPSSKSLSSPSSPRITSRPLVGLGIGTTDGSRLFPDEHSRLEAVTERTEPSSKSSKGSIRNSPSPTFGPRLPLPTRHPLPATPIKARSTASNNASPSKASDLIKMFENRTGDRPRVTPAHTGPERFERPVTPPPPPSSFRPPPIYGFEPPMLNQPSPENVESLHPVRSRSASPQASPAATFKSLVASWRNRSGSPSQRVIGTPGKATPGLARSGGWNVSIRRRRRDEGQEVGLAERAEDAVEDTARARLPTPPPVPLVAPLPLSATHPPDTQVERAPSLQSSRGSAPIISGEVSYTSTFRQCQADSQAIKAGTLWYLNVHDTVRAPNYIWIQADARLFPTGLQLAWRTDGGAQAMVTFDMEFCEGEYYPWYVADARGRVDVQSNSPARGGRPRSHGCQSSGQLGGRPLSIQAGL